MSKSAERPAALERPQPPDMVADMVHPGALDLWLADDKLWVPQAENVWMKPLMLNAGQGYYINLLRVRKAGILSCHRHSGPVHAFVLKGRWYYLEHDWVAEQ